MKTNYLGVLDINEDFFIQLVNAWLNFTNNKFPTSMPTEETLEKPIF